MADATTAAAGARVEQELEERFGISMADDLMAEALSILRLYGLSPADLFFKWEAFLLASSKQDNLPFNIENLRELRKDIQLSASTSNIATIRRDHAGLASASGGGMSSGNGTPGSSSTSSGNASRVKKLGGRAALDGILDGAPSTPLAKRAKMGGGGGTASTTTPASLTTPMARSVAGAGAMRPSFTASPSSMTPHPHGKAPFPSHLSRSLVPDSPGPSSSSFDSPSSSGTAIKFEDRSKALEVVETLNGHLQSLVGSATESSTSRIALASNANPKDYIYRYMFEKVSERATVLDTAIDEAADLVMQYYGIDDLGNPEHPSQDDIYCVGRVCPEGDNVRLTETSLLFESSRRYGGGMRVPLRFDSDLVVRTSDDPSFSLGEGGIGLFPGMIIGIKGRNPGGGAFTVSEVLMLPPVDQPQSSVSELIDYQHGRAKLDGSPMSVVTACGPFTVDENLSYAPLTALVEELSNLRPDLVVLLGPFVDASHPLIKAGDVDLTAHQLFQQHVAPKLTSLVEYSTNTTVILIPSVRDLISHNVVYPQAPLEREGLNLHKRVKLLPNPATFSVNEIVFAVTTADTWFSLKQNEYFKKGREASTADPSSEVDGAGSQQMAAPKDAMARICRHVLRQRSFYPLFPAPANPPLEPLNLDVTHSHLLRFNQGAGADVFIMPSMLKHFSKIVDSAVVINPASLTRKNQPGTFAKMLIYPTSRHELEQANHSMDVDEDNEDPASDHRVYERARVDIVRI